MTSLLPVVVHLKRKDGAVVQDCDVYIGRACNMGGWRLPKSVWANPFPAGKKFSREDAVRLYRQHIFGEFLKDPTTWCERLKGLLGDPPRTPPLPRAPPRLGCWCAPLACHGDVLVDFLFHCTKNGDALTPGRVVEVVRGLSPPY